MVGRPAGSYPETGFEEIAARTPSSPTTFLPTSVRAVAALNCPERSQMSLPLKVKMVRRCGMRANASDLVIELTEREKVLVSQIDFNPSALSHNVDSWRPIANAMEGLMCSLLERNAIPEVRRRFFSDPTFSLVDTVVRISRSSRGMAGAAMQFLGTRIS